MAVVMRLRSLSTQPHSLESIALGDRSHGEHGHLQEVRRSDMESCHRSCLLQSQGCWAQERDRLSSIENNK